MGVGITIPFFTPRGACLLVITISRLEFLVDNSFPHSIGNDAGIT